MIDWIGNVAPFANAQTGTNEPTKLRTRTGHPLHPCARTSPPARQCSRRFASSEFSAQSLEIQLKKSFNPRHSLTALLLGILGFLTTADAQSRGELLYSTHCISCHTSEMHWREKRAAIDWTSLKFQVRRWQDTNGLGWSEADVQEVARYLNESIYGYVRPSDVSMKFTSSKP